MFYLSRGIQGISPESVRSPSGCGFGLWVSQSDARYSCGQQFSFCRFTRMSFLPLFFSAALSRSFPFGKSWRSIPFGRSFSCKSANKKADTQRHQKSAGALLSLQNDETMYRLCKFRNHLFAVLPRCKQICVYEWCGKSSAAGSSISSFIFYLIGTLVKEHIYYIRNLVGNQDFSNEVLHSFGILGYNNMFIEISVPFLWNGYRCYSLLVSSLSSNASSANSCNLSFNIFLSGKRKV